MNFETKRYKKNRNVIAYGNELAKGAASKAADQTAPAVNHVGNTNQNNLETQKFEVDLQAKYTQGHITDATLFASLRQSGLSEQECLIRMQNCGALGNGRGKKSQYAASEKMDDSVPLPKKVAAQRNREHQAEREAESQTKEWHEESRVSSEPASFPKSKASQKQPPGAFLSIFENIVNNTNMVDSSTVTENVVDHSSVTGDVIHGSLYRKAKFSKGLQRFLIMLTSDLLEEGTAFFFFSFCFRWTWDSIRSVFVSTYQNKSCFNGSKGLQR